MEGLIAILIGFSPLPLGMFWLESEEISRSKREYAACAIYCSLVGWIGFAPAGAILANYIGFSTPFIFASALAAWAIPGWICIAAAARCD